MKTKYDSTPSAADAHSANETPNYAIGRNWSALALCGLLSAFISVLSAHPVEAQCANYNFSGQWTIEQGSFHIPVALSQNGNTVSGTAFHQSKKDSDEAYVNTEIRDVHGRVTGTVEGNSFEVQINWSGGGAGVYRGKIGQNGQLWGTTYDKNKPSSTAKWYTRHFFECANAVEVEPVKSSGKMPAPAPVVKPVKSSGKFPTPAPVVKPVKSSGKMPTETVPTIKANPVAVTIPAGQSHGRTTVTWDGGPDHPDAELWMKRHTQEEETLVVQQGKGTRSVTVELGTYYQFILKDAGQVLAKAAVLTRQ